MNILNGWLLLAQATPTPEDLAELETAIANLRTAIDNEMGVLGVIFTLLIISVSVAIGRSYVLLANRVTPLRLVLSMVMGILVFVFSLFVWTTAVFWIGRLYYDITFNFTYWEILALVILMFSPLSQAWLGLIPYLGSCFVRVQYILSVILLYVAMLLIGFNSLQAMIVILAGAGVLLIAQRTILLPLIALQNRIAGTHLRNRYRNVIRDSRLELR
jgi:hypothetical protein